MPSLKFLRNRIASVKSTKKITSAMKMVAASKLRQTQERQHSGKIYEELLKTVGTRIAACIPAEDMLQYFPIINEVQECKTHLMILVASDRGLCGGFNGNIVREAKHRISELRSEGKTVRVICIGRKARDLLKRDYADIISETYEDIAKPYVGFGFAEDLAKEIMRLYSEGTIGSCGVLYNKFVNALVQEPTAKQIIPFVLENSAAPETDATGMSGVFTFEPGLKRLFATFIPQSIAERIYSSLTDSAAGEQAARMNAMDNATNNAGDMIGKLTIRYNRARQANITKELIEIISAMEAM